MNTTLHDTPCSNDVVWLTLPGEIAIALPATLECPTTYVLLEQRRWFEREVPFLQRCAEPGATFVDVGANLGVYSLAIARAVGAAGAVFSFEPGTEARSHLLRSSRRNGFAHLQLSPCALSDAAREGWLLLGHSSEYNTLGAGDPDGMAAAERVEVSTLDRELGQRAAGVDIIKIDAEGEERRIIRGGAELLERCSPLVMYEIRNGSNVDSGAREELEARGFATYRLLGDASCLVPLAQDAVDPIELNLFAARPGRARQLAERGLLVESAETWGFADGERERAMAALLARPYCRGLEVEADDVEAGACADALLAYVAFADLDLSPNRRFAAIRFAYEFLDELCRAAPTATRLASLARVACDFGRPTRAVQALQHPDSFVGQLRNLMASSATHAVEIDEMFLPASARYDFAFDADSAGDWLISASLEQLEYCSKYSTRFTPSPVEALEWLCARPFASAEMHRRLALLRLAGGNAAVLDSNGEWAAAEVELLRDHGALVGL